MAKVFCKFPRTGLGNLMLVWARTMVFAKVNNLPYTVSLWWGFRLGPILRNEKKKRFYWGYFNETPMFKLLATHVYSKFAKNVLEPELRELTPEEKSANTLYIMNHVGVDHDLFGYIQGYETLVKEELIKLLTPAVRERYLNMPAPVISVHIRRGDFKNWGDGIKLTAVSYFARAIQLIRETTGKTLPVTVFSDAHPDEIKEIFDLPEVSMANNDSDILDILSMGQSRFLVLSRGSTFSYWGAYLSDALVIRPWDKQERIKSPSGNYAEVRWNNEDNTKDMLIIDAVKKVKV